MIIKGKQCPKGYFDWDTLTVHFGGQQSKPENIYTANAIKVPDFKHTIMEKADAGGGAYYSYKEPVEYEVNNAFIILRDGVIIGWMRAYKDIKKPDLLPIDWKHTPGPVKSFAHKLKTPPMTPTISKELQEQIEREAESYGSHPLGDYASFKDGATAYAHYKERCEELERWKEEAVLILTPLLYYGQSKEANIPLGANITTVLLERAKRFEQAKKALEEIASGKVLPQLIAQQILASWKDEDKEVESGKIELIFDPEFEIWLDRTNMRGVNIPMHLKQKMYINQKKSVICSATGKPIDDCDCGSEHK